jgi:hypothetical protein
MYTTKNDTKQVPVLIGEPPSECVNCRWQFLGTGVQEIDDRYRYETIVTPAAVRTSLVKFINQINNDRAYLHYLCDKHGNAIASRWRKKSQNKREALLLLADPTMEKEP